MSDHANRPLCSEPHCLGDATWNSDYCGRHQPPTAQAVQVAAGGAPPLTPEGQDATRLVAAVVSLLDEYMPRWSCDHRRRDPSGHARSGWADVVPKWRELAEAVSATPPQADAKAIPSPAPQAPPPEGATMGMAPDTIEAWSVARTVAAERDAAIARAEAAEKEVAADDWIRESLDDAQKALAACSAERDRMRDKLVSSAAIIAKDCWSYYEDEAYELALDLYEFLGLPLPLNCIRKSPAPGGSSGEAGA